MFENSIINRRPPPSMVTLLFVQFILVQPVFVQSISFNPNLIVLDEKLWTKRGWTKNGRTPPIGEHTATLCRNFLPEIIQIVVSEFHASQHKGDSIDCPP